MKVKLLSHTPDPEKLVAAAAKNCYSASNVDNILEGLAEEKTESFVNMLSEIGHESPIEHVSFTFAIEGVSRSLLAQITRLSLYRVSVTCAKRVLNMLFRRKLIKSRPHGKNSFKPWRTTSAPTKS